MGGNALSFSRSLPNEAAFAWWGNVPHFQVFNYCLSYRSECIFENQIMSLVLMCLYILCLRCVVVQNMVVIWFAKYYFLSIASFSSSATCASFVLLASRTNILLSNPFSVHIERCNVDVDRLLLSPAPSVVWVFPCFLVVFWSDLVLSFDSLLKLSGYAFLVKCWQYSIWPGFVCQVQMWSMIENYICAWHSYFQELILHVHSACL